MNLIKYYPRFPQNRMGNFFDDFFNKSLSDVVGSDFTMNLPAINVVERADSFLLELAAPGLRKEDFDVSIEEDKLILSAEVFDDPRDTGDNFTRREFNYQSFKRSFFLPENIQKEGIGATYENGVLKVVLPKMEARTPEEKTKRIEIS